MITTRWVGVNKGGDESPKYRSRLVARELNTHDETGLFAATPPLGAKKVLFSMAMTNETQEEGAKKLAFLDVRRAYFYAPATRPVFIKLPEEDAEPGMCGKLQMSMCGTRDAAKNWEAEYQKTMAELGFKYRESNDSCFPPRRARHAGSDPRRRHNRLGGSGRSGVDEEAAPNPL